MRAVCLIAFALLFCLPLLGFAQKKTDEKDEKKADKKADKKPDFDKLLEKREYKQDKASLNYRLMKPEGYKDDGKHSYPLVIFLHGAGERGKDNAAQLKHGVADFAKDDSRKKYPCFLIAPQCPASQVWVYGSLKNLSKTKPAVEAGEMVLALLDELKKEFRIDSKRIYLTGLSMGGYGTWELLARKPDLFAAAMPICGGGDVKKAEKIAKIPIWCFHGDKDGAVPVARSREMIEAIKKAGGEPKYTEYEGVGHDSWTQTYRDPKVMAWLFEQKKG
jgi:predicted peptidase